MNDDEISILQTIQHCLEPLSLASKIICKNETSAYKSEQVIDFCVSKLENSGGELSLNICKRFSERTLSRRNDKIYGISKWLNDPSNIDELCKKSIKSLIGRLYPTSQQESQKSTEVVESQNIEDEFESFLKRPKYEQEPSIDEEINIFSSTGIIPKKIELLRDALLSVRGSSVLSERVFSLCGNFVRPRRNRMSAELLHALIILNFDFQ